MYPGAHLSTRPNDPAVLMADSGETVTFTQSETRSIQVARTLADRGLRPGDHLAVVDEPAGGIVGKDMNAWIEGKR